MDQDLVKMSSKGQLVVPQKIRKKQKFKPTDKFVAFEVKEGIVFKRVKIPDVRAEFKSLSREISEQFKEKKITSGDVKGAIKWTRKG